MDANTPGEKSSPTLLTETSNTGSFQMGNTNMILVSHVYEVTEQYHAAIQTGR